MQLISTFVNVARHLRREPGFVALVVLVLGLALGGTTAMLSVVHGVLLKPLPYGEAERLVLVGHRHAEQGEVYGAFSPQDYADLAERSSSVESASAYHWRPGQSTVNAMLDDKPAQLDAAFVTGNFFATLGAPARLGRALTAEDDKPGNDVVVLSDRAWRTLFGADAGIVGKTARIHGRPFEVVGVMPPEFDFPDARVQVYVPQSFITEDGIPRLRQVRWLDVVARLRPGVAHTQAAREIDAVVASVATDNPETNENWNHAAIKPLFDAITAQSRGPLVALAVATFLVLLTACVNLANLMLARAQRRERELATRGALGATPSQLAAQLFGEAVVLTGLGAVFGLVLAQGALRLLQARESAPLMRQAEIGLSPWVLVAGALVALFTAIAISAVPVWRARRLDAAMALSRGGVSTTSRRQGLLRATLVVAQVALVCALGYTTALALESFRRLTSVDVGVAPERVLTFNVSLEGPRYEAQGTGAAARQRILANLRELPGVVSVAGSKNEPVGQTGEGYGFSYVDRPEVPINPDWGVLFVTHGYFDTLGIPLLRGRDFTGREKPGEAITLVVNKAFAEKYFPGQDVVGKSMRWGDETTVEIVGLAADARHAGPRDAPKPVAYVSLDQISRSSLVVTLRTTARGSDIVPRAREAVWSVDRELPIVGMRWLDEQIASLSEQSQLLASALSGFALMAALLGGLGVFSLLAYVVGERRRELAIRLAIGERPAGLFRRVVGQGARLALIGIACGVPLGFAAARVLQAELFETRLFEPGVLAAVVLGVAVLALAAAIAPALSALRTQPMTVLRQE